MKEIKLKSGKSIKVYIDGQSGNDEGGEVYIQSEAFCEHCMELEPYSLMFSDGGTTWCEICAECIEDEAIEELLKDRNSLRLLEKMAIEEKMKYYNKRIYALEEELDKARREELAKG